MALHRDYLYTFRFSFQAKQESTLVDHYFFWNCPVWFNLWVWGLNTIQISFILQTFFWEGQRVQSLSKSVVCVIFIVVRGLADVCKKLVPKQYLFVIHTCPSNITRQEFWQEFQQLKNCPLHKHRWTFRAPDSWLKVSGTPTSVMLTSVIC